MIQVCCTINSKEKIGGVGQHRFYDQTHLINPSSSIDRWKEKEVLKGGFILPHVSDYLALSS